MDFNASIDKNPLLEDLTIELEPKSIWGKLHFDPWKDTNVLALSYVRKELLLDTLTQGYIPTQRLVEIAASFNRMYLLGYVYRNPYNPAIRRWLNEFSRWNGTDAIKLPSFSVFPRGMIIKGITKSGKTALIQRILSGLPSVIQRPSNREAGWLALNQLCYLTVPMSTDGSKSGFLRQCFLAFDAQMGTDYGERKRIMDSTIDMQLTEFLNLLVQHRCGALLVEENQEDNSLNRVTFGKSFGSFFLRVLNSGIPLILIGNPKAFDELETNAQFMSRMSDPGVFELFPSPNHTAAEWKFDLVPGIWRRTIFSEGDVPLDNLEARLWEWTGGSPHWLTILRREALRAALSRQGNSVALSDIEKALISPSFREGAAIMASYWSGQGGGDVNHTDIRGEPSAKLLLMKGSRRGRR